MTNTPENKAKSTPGQKLSWGFGGFAENLGINVVPALAYNIFQIGMGISPFIIGLALGASRIVEAVTDPIIGNWSDNSRTKWGRRRPFIFIGAIIISLIFVSIWYTPRTGWIDPYALKNANVTISNVKIGANTNKSLTYEISRDSVYTINKDSSESTLFVNVNQLEKGQIPFALRSAYTYASDSSKTICPNEDLSYGMNIANNSKDTIVVRLSLVDKNDRAIQVQHDSVMVKDKKVFKDLSIDVKVNPNETKTITEGTLNAEGHKLSGKFVVDKESEFDAKHIDKINVAIYNYSTIPSFFFGIPIHKDSLLQSIYLILVVSLFFMTFAIWQIPFSALGLELEEEYNERTKLQQYKLYFSYLIGTAIGSLYLLAQMRSVWGGDEITGVRYLGLIIGGIMLLSGLLPAIICRERYQIKSATKKIKFFPALMETFKDAPFRLFMASVFFVFLSLFFMLPLLGYISMYHVCKDGMQSIIDWSWRAPFTFHVVQKYVTHKELSGILGAFGAVVQTTTQILSIILISSVSKYFDKKTILMAGLSVAILGYFSSWFLFNPAMPYLSILPPIIINIGLCAIWVLMGSFSADICDYDEMKTGLRREGMFSAVTGFLIKLSIALVIAISSWILVQLGIEGSDPKLTVDQLFTLRWLYIAIPVTAIIIAIIFMVKYPLTRKKVEEIQAQLAINRAQ